METNNRKQLVTQDNGNIEKIFPKNYMSNIVDEETGESLRIFLLKYNHIDLGYRSSKSSARLAVPIIMRRKGLYITYYLPDDIVITEFFNGNKTEVSDTNWIKDELWVKDVNELNVYDIKISDGSITLDKLSEEVMQLISSKGDITINNFPDNEDLELYTIYQDSNNKIDAIRFKDRDNSNGMAYKYLRKTKNMILSQSDFNQANTIYEIRYDFDLNGNTINIPDSCELKFVGGSLKNGTINFNKTRINSGLYSIFNIDTNFTGTCNIKEVYPEWFGAKADNDNDDTNAIQKAIDFCLLGSKKVVLQNKTYKILSSLSIKPNISFGTNVDNSGRVWSSPNIVQYNGSLPIIKLECDTGSLRNICLHDLYITYESYSTSNSDGIYIDSDINTGRTDILQNSSFNNLFITNCRYAFSVHSIGYLGFSINKFSKCTFYGNTIAMYFDCEEYDSRSAWLNLNELNLCVIDNNKIGGIYVKARSIQNFTLSGCNIQRTGNGYTYEDYITYGCYAIKCVATFGNIIVKDGYYEQNYPRRSGSDPNENEIIYNSQIIPKDINSINSAYFYISGVEAYFTNNLLTTSYKLFVLSGNWGLYTDDNDLYFPAVGYDSPKSLIFINSTGSNGNYNSLRVNELKQYSNWNTTSFTSVYEFKDGVSEGLTTINVYFPRLNCYINKVSNKYIDTANIYLSNTGNDIFSGAIKDFPKATFKSAFTTNYNDKLIINVINSIDTGSFISGGQSDIANKKNIVIQNNSIILRDNSWNITNTNIEFKNINFSINISSASYVMFKLFETGELIFNNCTFKGIGVNTVGTLCGFQENSEYKVKFINCSFSNDNTGTTNYYITKNISNNKSVVAFINSDITVSQFYWEANNIDGTLTTKVNAVYSPSNITQPNRIYRIIRDIDLGGTTLTLPANCTLDFQGGSFSNGTIVGSNTKIESGLTKIFGTDITLSGTWIADSLSPEHFGTTGVDATQDTTYIQKALDCCAAINIKTVKLQNKIYQINSSLLIQSNIKLEGATSRVWNNGSATILSLAENIVGISVESTGVEINDLKITGNATNTGISFTNRSYYFSGNKIITTGLGIGFDIQSSWTYIFNLCRIEGGTIGFKIQEGTSGTFNSCVAFSCLEYGFYVTKLNYGSFNGCGTDGCKYGFYFTDACRGVTLSSCGCENTQEDGYMVKCGARAYVTITAFSVGTVADVDCDLFIFEADCRVSLIDLNVGSLYHPIGNTLNVASGAAVALINCYLTGTSVGLENCSVISPYGNTLKYSTTVDKINTKELITSSLATNATYTVLPTAPLNSVYLITAVTNGNSAARGLAIVTIPTNYGMASVDNLVDNANCQISIDATGNIIVTNTSSSAKAYKVSLLKLV